MSTSFWGGQILFEDAEHDNDEAFDTLFMRMVVNNANHLADENAQVLVAFPPTADGSGESITPAVVDTKERIATFGPFWMRVRSNGAPYKLRARVHGRTVVAGTVSFSVLVHAPGLDILDPSSTSNQMTTSTLTATTGAWLTDAAGTNLVTLTSSHGGIATRTLSTVNASGDAVDVTAVEVLVTVFGLRSTAQGQPELTGLYVAEYIGV